jgi:F1F0 ATPase subunit 2
MKEGSILILALLAGLLLGTIFYGGLWWTVRRTVSSKSPGAWLIGSFSLRAMIAVGGFYFVSRGDWRSWLACFLGFLVARIVATRVTRAPLGTKIRLVRETGP